MLGLFFVVAGLAQAAPLDEFSFVVGSLLRVDLAPALPVPAAAGLGAKVPPSVAPYLRPSVAIDSQHPSILALGRKVLGRLVGCALPADAVLAEQAVDAVLDQALQVSLDDDISTRASTEWRMAWDKASVILRRGATDSAGRARVKVALLRAIKIPARLAWARGQLVTQVWQPGPKLLGPVSKNARASVAGQWLGEEALFAGELLDSWSLESGDLARLRWAPAQELSVIQASVERAYFGADEAAAAQAALDHVKSYGALPSSARLRAFPRARLRPGKPVPAWLLVVQRHTLRAQGVLNSGEFEALLPYRAHLASWGAEPRPGVDEFRPHDLVFWTDRPARVRLRANGLPQEGWSSPPPALGVTRLISFRYRQPNSLLSASTQAGHLRGHIDRADNLAPRASWRVVAKSLDQAWSVQGNTDAAGNFDLELPAKAKGRVHLSSPEAADQQRPDDLVLDIGS